MTGNLRGQPWCVKYISAHICAGSGGSIRGVESQRPGNAETFCPHCGQLYPSDAVECPRCPLTMGAAKGGKCPACAHALVPETMGDVTVDRCSHCGGTWFDRGEVVRVLDLHTQGVSGARLSELERRFPSYRVT